MSSAAPPSEQGPPLRPCPWFRLVCNAVLGLTALLHNVVVFRHDSVANTVYLIGALGVWSIASWLAFGRDPGRHRWQHLPIMLALGDIVVWTVVVYLTGAERSLLFFIGVLRAADASMVSFRRVLIFGHVAVACYALLILYVANVERPIDYAVELVKLALLSLASLYLAFAAKAAGPRAVKPQGAPTLQTIIADVSHELRTPLNGVIGGTRMLESSNLTPAQRQHVSLIRASAETLLQLVEQILDVSKLEASKLTIERIPFAPRATLAEALRPLTPRADRKGLLLRLHVEDSVPDALVGDPVRLRQIVVNLVDNAIKFTDDGEVEVRAVVEPGDTEAVHLHLTVRDTGIGIPRERRKAIFEAFTQADGSTVRTHGGSGLGLTISSRLAALMGGRLWLESEVGRGSTFHATLRCRRAPPRAPGRSGLTGVVALVAEPNQAHRAALVEMLDAWGMVTSQAETANEVVAVVARARDARRPYDVLFIGIDMVGMDGLRVVEHLRASNNFTGSIIMIMRAVARSGDRERCAELGVKAVVTRPLSQSEVFDALALALARPVTSGPALYASGPALYPRRTLDVLLADDNVINREVAMSYLSAWGHRVTPVQDGREALAMLEHHRFDVALLDIHMPGADGFDITRQIRRQETTTGRRLPIVAMTARARHGDRESCLSAGMDGYVAKPVQPELLFDELERVTASAPDFDTALLERAAGDPVLRQRIARLFLDHAPAVRARLHDALAGRDAAGLVDAAHWLKGAIGNLPAPAASEAAARVEILARAGDLEHAAAVCETLDAELDRLATALAAVVAKQRG